MGRCGNRVSADAHSIPLPHLAVGHAASRMFVLTVPHPSGGPPHLLAGRFPAEAANQLRRSVLDRRSPLIKINVGSLDPETPVEWCPVSDERASVTTRRYTGRPVNAFLGRTIHIWGCGGLGPWLAEVIARAGARRLVLCDPGTISGGLLVRQNFTEPDVGKGKAEALRGRILAIRDDIEVDAHSGHIPDDIATTYLTADVVIDATVSRGIGQFLDDLAPAGTRPLLAQVATDVKTGTLGILSVSAPGTHLGANEIDRRAGEIVKADGDLEQFHTFWTDVPAEDELIPTRGCSVPTFHGSAADMAAVAASLTSLLGSHMASMEPVSGTHLIALPHSPAGLLTNSYSRNELRRDLQSGDGGAWVSWGLWFPLPRSQIVSAPQETLFDWTFLVDYPAHGHRACATGGSRTSAGGAGHAEAGHLARRNPSR